MKRILPGAHLALLIFAIAFLLAVLQTSASVAIAQARPKILISTYEPFGGANVNWSENIANVTRKKLTQQGFDVEICRLPVVFDVAAAALKTCYQNMNPKPEQVISLGESDCTVRLETVAHNLDHNQVTPDNAGAFRSGLRIVKGGPQSIGMSAPVIDMYCSLKPKDRRDIEISKSPGAFVCNNTAYLTALYLKSRDVPYSFIHVPSHLCGNRSLINQAGHRIASMINGVRGPSATTVDSELSDFCDMTMPINLRAIKKLTGTLNKMNQESEEVQCHQDFLNQLQREYE